MVKHITFILCLLFIGITSAIDLAATVHYYPHITELNPVANWILGVWGVPGFIIAKMVGTIAVLGILSIWRMIDDTLLPLIIVGAIVLFQIGLMWFIFF